MAGSSVIWKKTWSLNCGYVGEVVKKHYLVRNLYELIKARPIAAKRLEKAPEFPINDLPRCLHHLLSHTIDWVC